MGIYGYGLNNHRVPPPSIKDEGLTKFSTLVGCHLLSYYCLPALSLYKMDNISITSSSFMSGLSMASDEEEADSLGPTKPIEVNMAIVKTVHIASLLAPLPHRSLHLWSEVLQSPHAPEGQIHCGMIHSCCSPISTLLLSQASKPGRSDGT